MSAAFEKGDFALATVDHGSSDDRVYNGVVFSITDCKDPQAPSEKLLTNAYNAFEWFKAYPEDVSAPIIKLLIHQIPPSSVRLGFDIPFTKKIIDEALWQSQVYVDWCRMQSGACAALIDDPARFILQTPSDGYPFISLAMSRRGHICKGILTYDTEAFDPLQMMPGETLYSGWRSDGTQIISLPQAILKTHSAWLAREISHTLKRLQGVEEALTQPCIHDFSALQRTLHQCQDIVLNLERRSEWESLIIGAVENVVGKTKYVKNGSWPALAPAKAAIKLRQADLTMIPRRIESARVAINDSILQQTQSQSLQIAQSTQRIAEATMHDSASMKTIAILTMVFLPGTAVASFFSMTMWDWNASDGSDLVSPWLWIYFAAAIPLTLGVIGVWYTWSVVRMRRLRMYLPFIVTHAAPQYYQERQSLNGKTD